MTQRWRTFPLEIPFPQIHDRRAEIPKRAKHEEERCVSRGCVDGGGDIRDADVGGGAVWDVALVVSGTYVYPPYPSTYHNLDVTPPQV